ncbi:hypothetical protein [Flavobacterium sp.]|jgi:hypothetical protein|uniref:hypothetical protein n=1 Tax=Flavobacterium sp. TaxID=239 RepID=UPI0037BE9B5E
MSDNKTAAQQLDEAKKQQEELAAKIDALLEQTRAEDLKTAKELIARHAFTVTDLKPELKTRLTKTTTAKKPTRRKSK